ESRPAVDQHADFLFALFEPVTNRAISQIASLAKVREVDALRLHVFHSQREDYIFRVKDLAVHMHGKTASCAAYDRLALFETSVETFGLFFESGQKLAARNSARVADQIANARSHVGPR